MAKLSESDSITTSGEVTRMNDTGQSPFGFTAMECGFRSAEERYANMLGPISPEISMITSAGMLFLRAAARIASGLGAS